MFIISVERRDSLLFFVSHNLLCGNHIQEQLELLSIPYGVDRDPLVPQAVYPKNNIPRGTRGFKEIPPLLAFLQ